MISFGKTTGSSQVAAKGPAVLVELRGRCFELNPDSWTGNSSFQSNFFFGG